MGGIENEEVASEVARAKLPIQLGLKDKEASILDPQPDSKIQGEAFSIGTIQASESEQDELRKKSGTLQIKTEETLSLMSIEVKPTLSNEQIPTNEREDEKKT